jgi:pyruvate kinase
MASHVSSAADVRSVRALAPLGMRVCAKVEDALGIENLQAIAGDSDSILLGQGDLLNDVGPARFGGAVAAALAQVAVLPIPLLAGTQLLDRCAAGDLNRAELGYLHLLLASGVAGVLLSGETTIGENPLAAVSMAKAISLEAQRGWTA